MKSLTQHTIRFAFFRKDVQAGWWNDTRHFRKLIGKVDEIARILGASPLTMKGKRKA